MSIDYTGRVKCEWVCTFLCTEGTTGGSRAARTVPSPAEDPGEAPLSTRILRPSPSVSRRHWSTTNMAAHPVVPPSVRYWHLLLFPDSPPPGRCSQPASPATQGGVRCKKPQWPTHSDNVVQRFKAACVRLDEVVVEGDTNHCSGVDYRSTPPIPNKALHWSMTHIYLFVKFACPYTKEVSLSKPLFWNKVLNFMISCCLGRNCTNQWRIQGDVVP